MKEKTIKQEEIFQSSTFFLYSFNISLNSFFDNGANFTLARDLLRFCLSLCFFLRIGVEYFSIILRFLCCCFQSYRARIYFIWRNIQETWENSSRNTGLEFFWWSNCFNSWSDLWNPLLSSFIFFQITEEAQFYDSSRFENLLYIFIS